MTGADAKMSALLLKLEPPRPHPRHSRRSYDRLPAGLSHRRTSDGLAEAHETFAANRNCFVLETEGFP